MGTSSPSESTSTNFFIFKILVPVLRQFICGDQPEAEGPSELRARQKRLGFACALALGSAKLAEKSAVVDVVSSEVAAKEDGLLTRFKSNMPAPRHASSSTESSPKSKVVPTPFASAVISMFEKVSVPSAAYRVAEDEFVIPYDPIIETVKTNSKNRGTKDVHKVHMAETTRMRTRREMKPATNAATSAPKVGTYSKRAVGANLGTSYSKRSRSFDGKGARSGG